MSDDLVKRLREFWMMRFALWGTGTKSEFESDKLHQEAAGHIEKLEAALREIAADFGTVSAVGTMDALYSAAAILAERINIARKALEGKDD